MILQVSTPKNGKIGDDPPRARTEVLTVAVSTTSYQHDGTVLVLEHHHSRRLVAIA
jgi:hypothetical protein